MKITASLLATAAFLGLSVATAPASPPELPVQKVIETTTTSGTIGEFGTDRMVIHTKTSRTPLGYTFTKTTTYVDENGAPVAFETVKSGLPVTVYFTREGDRMNATRVIVRKASPPAGVIIEKKTTTIIEEKK